VPGNGAHDDGRILAMADDHAPSATGRSIPDPGFAGDDGSAHPALAEALAAYSTDRSRVLEVFVVLQRSRILVPVLAVPSEVEVDNAGRTVEKVSDMATVLVTGRDGRRAMLGFTSTESMAAWRDDARPVPVAAPIAARAALEGGAAALLVDLAGPTTYVVEGDLLDALAGGWVLADTGQGLAFVEEIHDEE
jgi:type III secretion system (T3SS) SseB-like protein